MMGVVKMPRSFVHLNPSHYEIDPKRKCELCGGPIIRRNTTGVCRTTSSCMQESMRRRTIRAGSCKICGGVISRRNKIPICRTNSTCRAAGKKEHDRRYHRSHKNRPKKSPSRRQTVLLPEDGIIDPVAVHIAVHGIRKIAMTHRERVEAVRQMLQRGDSIREICDHLHVPPATAREILDELGYECVRNEHIAGSKIMIILPKNRRRGPKLLTPDLAALKPSASTRSDLNPD
jgi:Homeodomain-like domain